MKKDETNHCDQQYDDYWRVLSFIMKNTKMVIARNYVVEKQHIVIQTTHC